MPKRKSDLILEDVAPSKKPKSRMTKGTLPAFGGVDGAAQTPAQKSAVASFVAFAGTDRTTAAKILKQYGWNVEAAMDGFYGGNASCSSQPPPVNSARIALSKVFDKYRDDPRQSPDEINAEGTGQLLNDLNVDLADVGALVFSQLVGSPSLGTLHREPFLAGCSAAGIDSVPKLRTAVAQRRSQLATDPNIFRDVYNHTFALALSERQKSLPVEEALEFWRVLFSPPGRVWASRTTPWLEWWTEFYTAKVNKAVNKDLWKQTLNFANKTLEDDTLGFWSEESSWPSVIDEFVEWVKKEKRPEELVDGDAMEED